MTITACPPYNGVARGGITFKSTGATKDVGRATQCKMGNALRTKLGLDVIAFNHLGLDKRGRIKSDPTFLKFIGGNPKEILRKLKKSCVSTVKGELDANEKKHAKPFCASAIKSVETYINDTKPTTWQEYKPYLIGAISMLLIFIVIPHVIMPYLKKKFGKGGGSGDGEGGGTVNNGHHTHVHGNPIQVVLNNPVPGRYDIKVGEDQQQIDVPETTKDSEDKGEADSTVAARVAGLVSIMQPKVAPIYRPVSAAQASAVAAKGRTVATTTSKAMTPKQLGTLLITGLVYLLSRGRSSAPTTAPQRALVSAY